MLDRAPGGSRRPLGEGACRPLGEGARRPLRDGAPSVPRLAEKDGAHDGRHSEDAERDLAGAAHLGAGVGHAEHGGGEPHGAFAFLGQRTRALSHTGSELQLQAALDELEQPRMERLLELLSAPGEQSPDLVDPGAAFLGAELPQGIALRVQQYPHRGHDAGRRREHGDQIANPPTHEDLPRSALRIGWFRPRRPLSAGWGTPAVPR